MARTLIVDPSSAAPQLPGVTLYGIEATHSGMCKFGSEADSGYGIISTAIREWAAEAQNVIPIRWKVEESDRQMRVNLETFERVRPFVSPVRRVVVASTLTDTLFLFLFLFSQKRPTLDSHASQWTFGESLPQAGRG